MSTRKRSGPRSDSWIRQFRTRGRQPALDPRLDPGIDPKRAKRILANRLSAARSKLKQKSHLEVGKEGMHWLGCGWMGRRIDFGFGLAGRWTTEGLHEVRLPPMLTPHTP